MLNQMAFFPDRSTTCRLAPRLLFLFAPDAGHDVRGRPVLDGGAGAGRYAEVVAGWDAEVVAIDLAGAIDVAAENLRGLPSTHFVQADLFALPFRSETFDMAYSIGVLHHTPDTAAAFREVAALVKKGG